MKKSTALRLLLLIALAGGAAAVLLFVPIKQYLEQFLEWADGLGPWGPAVLAAAYVPASIFLVPGSLLTLGAGAICST